jgi:glycosyltransferase involved in cell wall biosynthesis
MIFERNFGWRTRWVNTVYRLYGWQDLIVCQSERMRASICDRINRLADRCVVLGNPIDLDRIASDASEAAPEQFHEIPSERTKIVWCGRLVCVKAPIRAVATLRELHDRGFRDSHLIFVGDGPLESNLKDAIRQAELSEYVTLLGFVSRPASVMARCDIGLLTSDVEGFPNVILEMLASGVRGVVTTNCAGGLNDLPQVHVANEADPRRLAEIVASLIKSIHEPISSRCTFPSPRSYLQALGVNAL